VQIATDCLYQRHKSSREYHCIVMLRLPGFCIVIDPVADAFAIKVPLNGIWAQEYSYYSFRYVGIGHARLLLHIDMQKKTPRRNLSTRLPRGS
jgi:hypothetical protein